MEQVVIKNHFRILERVTEGAERLVTGIVADPENVDSYGQTIERDVVRKMALMFMERFGNMGTDHAKDPDGNPIILNDDIIIVESWVTREESSINGQRVPVGAWLLTCRIVNEDIWQRVVDGELNGYSFEAVVWRVPLDEDEE